MAISYSTVWEARATGSALNGGGYRTESGLPAPAAPSLSISTNGGKLPRSQAFYVACSWVDSNYAYGPVGPAAMISSGGGTDSSRIVVTPPTAPAGASWFNAYVANSPDGPFWPGATYQNVGGNWGYGNPLAPVATSGAAAPAAPTATFSSSGGNIYPGTYYFAYAYRDAAGAWTAVGPTYTNGAITGFTNSYTFDPPTQGVNTGWMVFAAITPLGPFFGVSDVLTDFGAPAAITGIPIASEATQPRGADYTQQDSAELALADLVCTSGSALVTSATGGFTRLHVGNIIQLQGANAGFYELAAYLSPNAALLKDPVGTSATGVSARLGGALDLPTAAAAVALVRGNKCYVRGDATYTLPASGPGAGGLAIANTAVSPANAPDNQPLRLIGYGAVRADLGVVGGVDKRPVIVLQASGVSNPCIISATGGGVSVENLVLDCDGVADSTGLSIKNTYYVTVSNVKVSSFGKAGFDFTGSAGCVLLECEARGGMAGSEAAVLSAPGSDLIVDSCAIHSNTCPGIKSYGLDVLGSVIAHNTGATSDGIVTPSGSQVRIRHCVIHASGRHGINLTTSSVNSGWVIKNNVITENAAHGLAMGTAPGTPISASVDNNVYYSNNGTLAASGSLLFVNQQGVNNNSPHPSRDTLLVSDPYVDSAGMDFRLAVSAPAGPAKLPGLAPATGRSTGAYAAQGGGGGGVVGLGISRALGGI